MLWGTDEVWVDIIMVCPWMLLGKQETTRLLYPPVSLKRSSLKEPLKGAPKAKPLKQSP